MLRWLLLFASLLQASSHDKDAYANGTRAQLLKIEV